MSPRPSLSCSPPPSAFFPELVMLAHLVLRIDLPLRAERTEFLKAWIVRVATLGATVERGPIRRVELSAESQPSGEIGIGDKGASERDEVCRSSRERVVRRLSGESP